MVVIGASHTKTMLPTKKSATGSNKPSDHNTKTSLTTAKTHKLERYGGHVSLSSGLAKHSYKAVR